MFCNYFAYSTKFFLWAGNNCFLFCLLFAPPAQPHQHELHHSKELICWFLSASLVTRTAVAQSRPRVVVLDGESSVFLWDCGFLERGIYCFTVVSRAPEQGF